METAHLPDCVLKMVRNGENWILPAMYPSGQGWTQSNTNHLLGQGRKAGIHVSQSLLNKSLGTA